MGFPGYFLVTADLLQLRQALGQPARRPRPRLGGGLAGRLRPGHHRPRPDPAQADLRAVPQPRAHLDARHRHGLRRAPARRDDPLRHREVRRGPDRPDHHLLHDQGEGRDQGLGAGALRPARLRGGRPDHQVDAAARSWARTSRCRGCSTPATSATPRPPRCGRSTSPTRRSRRSSTPPADLEGLKRQWGVHAAGVIMSKEPLIDVIPIQRREADGAIITQFDMGVCETLGLLKMDFLGLRNLTIIDDALDNITLNGKPPLDLDNLGLDDQGDLRAARPRRDARGVPARRRADARPAASHGAHRVRRHLRRRRAVPARSDGRQRAQRLRRPQERAPGGHADPPGAGRAAQGDPRRDLRPDRLPGTGHGDRPDARRATRWARPTCCAARWARRRRRSSTRSTRVSPRA